MSRPLRVIHLTLGLDTGGQEKLLVEFARHADRARVDLNFVSLTTRGKLAGDLEACGWPVTALDAPSGLRPRLVMRLASLFRQLRAEIVHTHDDRPNVHGAPAARLAGARCVHTRHHQGTHLTPRQTLLIRAASLCDHAFVCISHDSAAVARKQGIAGHRLRVIHNGIDLARFAFRGPAPTGYAVTVARLSDEKSLDTLLDAVAIVKQQHPDFRLLLAGDGPRRDALLKQAAPLGDSVRFLGDVRDVPALLAGARFFVLPSRTEGISLTLLEAMARGLATIACRVGGNPEVVSDSETGLLVPPRDPVELARAVASLWTRADSCATMGVSGRRRVEAHFDVRRMVADYEALYQK